MPDSGNVITEIKISELEPASQANASDQLEANQSGTTRRITLDQVATVVADSDQIANVVDGAIAAAPTPPALTDFSPRAWGGVGDGVIDDRAALQAAIDACAAAGGGRVNLTGGRWLIDSGDLIMKSNVFLVGHWLHVGYATVTRDYRATKSTIVLNSLYTIKFDYYDSTYRPFNSGLQGLIILKKGMGYPATLREGYDLVQTFTGIAITNNYSHDVFLEHLLIIGFQWGIWSSGAGRARMHYISGDNTNGIHIDTSADIQHLSRCHMWAYATAHSGAPVSYTVTAVANAAGLIRLTVNPLNGAGSPNILKTGDRVTVTPGSGSNSRGAWIITVITPYNPASPTTPVVIDLQGSTFVGPYTAGSVVWIDGYYRSGIAYDLDTGCEWAEAHDSIAYGYAIGWRLNDCYPATLVNCNNDGSGQTDDQTTIGFLVTGATQNMASLIGCKSAAAGTCFKIDTFSPDSDIVLLDNCRSWASPGTDFWFARGAATLVNCAILSTGPVIKIDNAAKEITFIGGDFHNLPAITFQSSSSPRPSYIGVRGHGNVIRGTGQLTSAVDTSDYATSSHLYLQDSGVNVGNGGMLMFGAYQGAFAAIKGLIISGANNTYGSLAISTRRNLTDATLTETARFTRDGHLIVKNSEAPGAAVLTQSFIMASSTANLGMFYGQGAPTGLLAAAKGSLYTNITATTTTTRLYVNTDGTSSGWTNLTTAA